MDKLIRKVLLPFSNCVVFTSQEDGHELAYCGYTTQNKNHLHALLPPKSEAGHQETTKKCS